MDAQADERRRGGAAIRRGVVGGAVSQPIGATSVLASRSARSTRSTRRAPPALFAAHAAARPCSSRGQASARPIRKPPAAAADSSTAAGIQRVQRIARRAADGRRRGRPSRAASPSGAPSASASARSSSSTLSRPSRALAVLLPPGSPSSSTPTTCCSSRSTPPETASSPAHADRLPEKDRVQALMFRLRCPTAIPNEARQAATWRRRDRTATGTTCGQKMKKVTLAQRRGQPADEEAEPARPRLELRRRV